MKATKKELSDIYKLAHKYNFDDFVQIMSIDLSSQPEQPREPKPTKADLESFDKSMFSFDAPKRDNTSQVESQINKVIDYLEGKVVSGMELSEALEISELLSILNKYVSLPTSDCNHVIGANDSSGICIKCGKKVCEIINNDLCEKKKAK